MLKFHNWRMIYLHQVMAYGFHRVTRVLFSRYFAYAKFRDNKTLAKISEFTVSSNETVLLSTQNKCVKIPYLTLNFHGNLYLNAKETQPFSIHFFFHMDHMRVIS